MKFAKKISEKFTALLGSRWAWYGVFALFIFQALWLALSMVYPGVFDEGVHFETIKLYATQWSPFFDSQPVSTDNLGQIIGQTSFLFYWLFSFIYRLFTAIGISEVGIILLLRFINIALFAGGLTVGRKLLRELSLSRASTNLILFIFTMTPIVPQLAGQINYDNPLFLLTNLFLLLSVRFVKNLESEWFSLRRLLAILLVGATAAIVKVAFLPILAGALVVVGWQLYRYIRASDSFRAEFTGQISPSGWRDYGLVVALIVVGSLGAIRYGGNLVAYGQLQPGCDAVLNEQRCRAFGPYGRDFELRQNLGDDFEPDPIYYAKNWYRGMHRRLLFTINGNTPIDRYQNFDPLPIASATVYTLTALGAAGIILQLKRNLSSPKRLMVLVVAGLYVGILLTRNYFGSYLRTGELVAINGRYLLMILLPLMAVGLRSVSEVIGERQRVKALLAGLVIIGMLQGGGISGFIIRSQPTWWWPVQEVGQLNQSASRVVEPLIIGD